ncbi:cystinosin [Tanacetum coccineum]
MKGVDLVLWGDLRIMFDANAEDELWQNQERWNLKSWDLYENCDVHTLILEDGTEIHMLAEKKYPLTKETLERMLSLRLVVGTASEDAYTLLRFIQAIRLSGKTSQNSLIAIVCCRTIMVLNSHVHSKELASPKANACVVGLNFDFVVLNLTKHSSYLIYNAAVYFSSAVQLQYHQKYGFNEMIPVAANDVAFSIHAVVLTAFTLFQIAIYDAVMNFKRKSTIGFSIGNILLDLLGGVANYGQMAIQSIDQHSWVNFYGNIGKTLLSLVSIFFDILFILQHYVIYPASKTVKSPSPDMESQEPLVTSSEDA